MGVEVCGTTTGRERRNNPRYVVPKTRTRQNPLHEQAIATSDFVIVICTDKYAKRADNREGGVGCESTVITGQMAEDILTNKFLPVLRSGTYKTATPIYLKAAWM
jgi:hypothetical protein